MKLGNGMLWAAFAVVAGAWGAPCASDFERASPESQGVSSAAIQRWIEACENDAATNRFGNGYVHGFVILRHGRLIAEGTWAPQDTLKRPHMLYSHSKSFTSTAVGFLVDDGRLDLDRRVVSLFPDAAPTEPSENLRQVRVRDLLTMNLGADRTDAERDETIRKVQVIFVMYAAELTRFSRRTRSRLDQWAPFRSFGVSPESIRATDGDTLASWAGSSVPTHAYDHDDRYAAVNVLNRATVEIRIFRGTLKRDTLIAAIQIVSNIFEYAMTHTWDELRTSTWADVAAYKPYKELVNYMIARGLLAAEDVPETLPAGNRPSDFYGVDGIARQAHA